MSEQSSQELIDVYRWYCDHLPTDADDVDVFNHCIQRDIETSDPETKLTLALIKETVNRRFHQPR